MKTNSTTNSAIAALIAAMALTAGAQTQVTIDASSGTDTDATAYNTTGGLTIDLGFFVDYLIVGGGGGGGGSSPSFNGGGGGGGGAVLYGESLRIPTSSDYAVLVGTGGVGGDSPARGGSSQLSGPSISAITAGGGGQGGGRNGAGASDDGSGAGGSYAAGGTGSFGGASGLNGGAGTQNDITGVNLSYAGGGGAGSNSGAGGSGASGGGNGGAVGGFGGGFATANTGGGGGGGGYWNGGDTNGGNGGSGVVIIRYAGDATGITGGTVTAGTGSAAGSTLSTFTAAGTSTFGVDLNARLGTTLTQTVAGTGDLTFAGPGRLALDAANTYSGRTTIESGTLALGANASIANSSEIALGNGARFEVSAQAGIYTVLAAQTLSGGGTVEGAIAIEGTHTPGFSPGLQSFEDGLSYASGASFVWELTNNTTADRGVNFDAVDVSGAALNFAAGLSADLVFDLDESSVAWSDAFWDNEQSWLVFGSIVGTAATDAAIFDTVNLSADSTGAALTAVAGREDAFFFWSQDGNNILLNYSPVPEPASYAALFGLLALGLAAARRRGIFSSLTGWIYGCPQIHESQ